MIDDGNPSPRSDSVVESRLERSFKIRPGRRVAVLRLKLQGAELTFDEYQQAVMRELGADHVSVQRKVEVCLFTATISTSAVSNGTGDW